MNLLQHEEKRKRRPLDKEDVFFYALTRIRVLKIFFLSLRALFDNLMKINYNLIVRKKQRKEILR